MMRRSTRPLVISWKQVKASQPGAVVYLENLVPVNAEKCAANKQPYYVNNDRVAAYNAIFPQLAEEYQVVLLDVAEPSPTKTVFSRQRHRGWGTLYQGMVPEVAGLPDGAQMAADCYAAGQTAAEGRMKHEIPVDPPDAGGPAVPGPHRLRRRRGGGPDPYDPETAAQALLDSGAFSDALDTVDQDTAAALYGIDADTITGSAVYTSPSAGAEEIAVLVLTDEDAAAARPGWAGGQGSRPEGCAGELPADGVSSWTAPLWSSGATPSCWPWPPMLKSPGRPGRAG